MDRKLKLNQNFDYGIPPAEADPEAVKEQLEARKKAKAWLMAESEFFYDTIEEEIEIKQLENNPIFYETRLAGRNFSFFKNGEGTTVNGLLKTFAETNAQRDGGIPKGERWMILDIGLNFKLFIDPKQLLFYTTAGEPTAFNGTLYGTVYQYLQGFLSEFIARQYYLAYKKQVTERILGQFGFHPAGYGIDHSAVLGGSVNNGMPQMLARRSLKRPLILEAQDSFEFKATRPREIVVNVPVHFNPADPAPEDLPPFKAKIEYTLALWGLHDTRIPQ